MDEILSDIENPKWRSTSVEFCGGTYVAPPSQAVINLISPFQACRQNRRNQGFRGHRGGIHRQGYSTNRRRHQHRSARGFPRRHRILEAIGLDRDARGQGQGDCAEAVLDRKLAITRPVQLFLGAVTDRDLLARSVGGCPARDVGRQEGRTEGPRQCAAVSVCRRGQGCRGRSGQEGVFILCMLDGSTILTIRNQVTEQIAKYFAENPNATVFAGKFDVQGDRAIMKAATDYGNKNNKAIYVFSVDTAKRQVAHQNFVPKELVKSKKLDAKTWLGEVSKLVGGKVSPLFPNVVQQSR